MLIKRVLLFVTGEFKQKRQECLLIYNAITGESKCKLPCFEKIMGRFVVEVYSMIHSFLFSLVPFVKMINSQIKKKKICHK
jgi:hypothetical protein